MTAKKLNNPKSYLEDAGFLEEKPDVFAWRGASDRSTTGKNGQPWRICKWEVESRINQMVQTAFAVELEHAKLLENLKQIHQRNYPSFRDAAFHKDSQSGYWLLFEFVDSALDADQSRIIEEDASQREQMPHGLAGFHLSFQQQLGQLSFYMTKHFFIGNVPGKIFVEWPRNLCLALFGEPLAGDAHFNAYVGNVDAEDLRRAVLKGLDLPQSDELSLDPERQAHPFPEVRLRQEEGRWSLIWSFESELPSLVVPPIEVLEQKEVSRRFQELDELILLESYRDAHLKCLEFLERYPNSLYLIRRLAFLCLWTERSFDKKWLDLLTKYDPHNLMALSLWISRCLQDERSDVLLEYLSKLGNALGQNIAQFDQADIASLTLPEMLGDAWNSKDDQRAVACYERVLQTRGEIPRILVKLIRLMRDLDDANAEEAYMDRLLACEVPVRTRAAIYYRLAEIKESVDPEEAVQWALKSWQTNHSHVRYAMLAAKLMIGLGRAHEAVHVLIETSEYVTGDESLPMRLDLELKIADIWLASLQRSDLALERLGRARELGTNDTQVIQRMANLAEALGEQTIYIDLLLQFLEAASQQGKASLVEASIQKLIEIAAQTEDADQQGVIYSEVLTRSLIDAPLISGIIANPRIALPHDKILAAMDQQVGQVGREKRGPYLLLMGDIASQFTCEMERAQGYYEQAIDAGSLNQGAFEFLDRAYRSESRSDQRYGLLKKRYELAPPHEKNAVLHALYDFDGGVPESERDGHALQIFIEDEADIAPFEERLTLYEHRGDIPRIAALMEQLFQGAALQSGYLPLLERAVQAVQTSSYEGRFDLLRDFYAKIEAIDTDKLAIARRALISFWNDPAKKTAARYLERLLDAGEIPDFEPDEMLALLPDNAQKVLLLAQLAERVSENRAIGYLRRALRMARELDIQPDTVQIIVHRLAELTLLQDDELGDYLKLVRQSDFKLSSLGVFGHQLLLAQDDTSRGRLAAAAVEFILKGRSSPSDLEILRQGIQGLGSEQQIDAKVAWLVGVGFDRQLHGKDFAIEALRAIETWDHREASLLLIEKLRHEWDDEAAAVNLLGSALKKIAAALRSDLMIHYTQSLDALMGFPHLLLAVEFYIKSRDLVRAERSFVLALERHPRPEQIELGLQRMQLIAQEMNLTPWLQALLSELVDPNRVPAISAVALPEVMIAFALQLFAQQKDLRKALSYFEQVHKADRSDSRPWGPMIRLYREFNADSDLYELLYQIMPQLRKSPLLLTAYALDLLGLEGDLQRIATSLGLSADLTTVGAGAPASRDRPAAASLSIGAAVLNIFERGELDDPSRHGKLPPPVQMGLPDDAGTRGRAASADQSPVALSPPLLASDEARVTIPTAPYDFDLELQKIDLKAPAVPPKSDLIPPVHGEASGHFLLSFDEDGPLQLPPLPPLPGLPQKDKTAGQGSLPGGEASARQFTLPPIAPPKAQEQEPTPSREPHGDSLLGNSSASRARPAFTHEDWKNVAIESRAKPGLSDWLIKNPCEDKLEQQVALQVSALLEDQLQLLDQWPHRIWRQPHELFYDLRWSDRMSRDAFHPATKAPLARLMKTLLPVIAHQFLPHLNVKGIAEKLKARPEDVLRYRRPIDWKDDLIQRSALRFYTKYFVDNRFQIFHLPKIEDRIHFDYEKLEIYVDRDHHQAMPASHLFHRLAFLSRALHLEYFPFLVLSPYNDVFPLLTRCRRSLEQYKGEGLKGMLGMEKDALRVFLAQVDRDQLEELYAEVGSFNAEKVAKTTSIFVEQVYRVNIAETLDLVGAVESISNSNLIEGGATASLIIQKSPLLRSILGFSAELKFGVKGPL